MQKENNSFFQRRNSQSSIASPALSLQESLTGSAGCSGKQQQQSSLSPLSPLPPPSFHQPSPLPSPSSVTMTPNACINNSNNNNNTNPFTQLQEVPEEEPAKKKLVYMVEFKAGRTDFFYSTQELQVGDLVIVEADRGRDLGKIAINDLTEDQIALLHSQKNNKQQQQQRDASSSDMGSSDHATTSSTRSTSLDNLKRIHRLAAPSEINQLLSKKQDEQRALAVCQQKIKQRKLRMEVVDAEYQWYTHNIITVYFQITNHFLSLSLLLLGTVES